MEINAETLMAMRQDNSFNLGGTVHVRELSPRIICTGILAWISLLAALMPGLQIYCRQLWARDYYHFVPAAWLTVLAVAILRWDGRFLLTAGLLRWGLRTFGCIAAAGAISLSGALTSPWLSAVALMLTIWVGLDCCRDRETGWSLSPLMIPLALTIRPPMKLDVRMIQELQSLTTALASRVLSALDIAHITAGNVIQLRDQPLMVEQACSGVQSLFTLLFIASLIWVLRRYRAVRGLTLTLSAFFWTVVMNTVRVVIIAAANSGNGTDLATGWRHDALGYAVLTVAVLLMLSTDRLILLLLAPVPDWNLDHERPNPFVVLWNHFMRSVVPGSSSGVTSGTFIKPTVPVTAVLVIALFGGFTAQRFQATPASINRVSLSVDKVEDMLPRSTSDWSVTSFDQEQRFNMSQFGEFSHRWTVQSHTGVSRVMLDHTFEGWHDLTRCYQEIGWRVKEFRILDGDRFADWPAVQAKFVKPTGEHALLLFSLFDMAGQPVQPESPNVEQQFRLRMLQDTPFQNRMTLQTQVLHESFVPFSDHSCDLQQQLHLQARDALRRGVLETSAQHVAVASGPVRH